MSNSITYYGLPHDNELVKDICETWGHDLRELNDIDALYLVMTIARHVWENGNYTELFVSEEADELLSRLDELTENDKLRLIQAIANK